MPGILDLYSNPANAGILNLASGLLQASGPQMRPVSFGQALGQGMQQGMQGFQQAQHAQLQNQLLQLQQAEANRKANAPINLSPGGVLLDPITKQPIFQAPFKPEAAPEESPLARLLREKGSLPEGDPRRAAYDAAIQKATTTQPLVTNNTNFGPSGIDYGTPPKDMVWAREPDGKVKLEKDPQTGFMRPVAVPIGGGPVEDKRKKEEEARAVKDKQQKLYADVVTQDVDRALNIVEKSTIPVTGFGSFASSVPGTPAHDLSNLLNTIKANAGFDRLQQMRASSPTGGALGQVSETENKLLQATIGSVEQSQSKEQFVYNMRRLKDLYLDIIHGPGNRPEPAGGEPKKPSSSSAFDELPAAVKFKGKTIRDTKTGKLMRSNGMSWVEVKQ